MPEAIPAPGAPSAGTPQLPKISSQFRKALSAMPTRLIVMMSFGRETALASA